MSPHTGKVPCEYGNKTNGKNHLLIRHNKEIEKYMYLWKNALYNGEGGHMTIKFLSGAWIGHLYCRTGNSLHL